ncbi:MAG: sporulation transcriptional regulator SpoIIID [Clostridia bacterium]|nr:sporulation transcriptional regulator SpoIIID [Clostridia bacterium]
MDHTTRVLAETRERAEELALYLIENQSTVRGTAERFGISKSTVHKDVSEKLPKINPGLYAQVHMLFEKNKSERHLRGGEATRQKYRNGAGQIIN